MSDQDEGAPEAAGEATSAGGDVPEPGWYPDPAGKHEHRYWDGTQWSDQVSDAGKTSTDAMPEGGVAAPTDGGGGGGLAKVLLIGLGVVVAAVVAFALVQVLGGDESASGSGTL